MTCMGIWTFFLKGGRLWVGFVAVYKRALSIALVRNLIISRDIWCYMSCSEGLCDLITRNLPVRSWLVLSGLENVAV
jgi:hypothetical protein